KLTKLTVGLGWDPAKAGASIDCDSSVFLCKGGKLRPGADIVAFYNKCHSTGAVIHQGDNLTGAGSGDDEQIKIDLTKLPPEYDRLIIVVNIFMAKVLFQHFGKIKNCYMRLFEDKGKELCRYTLSDSKEYDKKTAMIFGELVKENGTWVFHAIGEGTKDGTIDKLAKRFQ
ncbi:MAG: TerD family protein, partial [Oscillospiraceae bacterium]|nr:TerD family protein [Oscillospiraceae bacterium]